MSNNENSAYEVYLYRYSNVGKQIVVDKLHALDEDTRVSVRDVSSEAIDTKLEVLVSIVNINRWRRYNSEKEVPSYVDVIKITHDKFFCIVSLCREVLGDRKCQDILLTLFETSMGTYFKGIGSREKCLKYWEKKVSEVPLTGDRKKEAVYKMDGEEFFEIIPQNMLRYDSLYKQNPTYLKALFTKAISQVMCCVSDKDSVIGQDYHDHGHLERVPIYQYNNDSDWNIEDIAGFLTDIDRYDDISYGELNDLCKYDIDVASVYSQSIVHNKRFRDMYKDMQSDTLYMLPTLSYFNCPINFVLNVKDSSISVHYFYDKLYLRKVSIEGINEAIKQLAEGYLNDNYVDIEIDKLLNKIDDTENKVLDAKITALRKLKGFADVDDDSITYLATKCGVYRRSLEQCAIVQNEHPNSLFVVVKGKVGIDCRDLDNNIHSLMLLKEMNVFGIESLIADRKSMVDYRVVTDEAILLSIDATAFWECAKKYPAIMEYMLELQTDRIEKFQKLWVMS
ncbi:MAG: cyclic nucleotide-binding domain-containing protein [Lachnospiraceae bacterium]|nr:cyclic nucleotide-binding domain-containing protein [Candidatus Colinaster equi]